MVFGTQMQATARRHRAVAGAAHRRRAVLHARRRLAGVRQGDRRAGARAPRRPAGHRRRAAEAAGRPSSATAGTRRAHELRRFLPRNQIRFEGSRSTTRDAAAKWGDAEPEAGRAARRCGSPTARTLFRPDAAALAGASGCGPPPARARVRHGDHRRRPGRARRGGLRRLRGPADPRRRARGAGRAGRDLVADRELPRLSQRHLRRRARQPRAAAGAPARRRDPDHPPVAAHRPGHPHGLRSTATRRSARAPSSSPPA